MREQDKSNDEIDLTEIFSIINNKKWIFIILIIITSLISSYVYYETPETYTSSVNIQVNLNKKKGGSILDELSFGSGRSNSFGSELELIKSRKLLSNVVDILKLNEEILEKRSKNHIPEYIIPALSIVHSTLSKIKNPLSKDAFEESHIEILTTKKLQDMLAISYSEAGGFITISITSYNAELSKNIANTIANSYIQYKDREVDLREEKTLSWLSSELRNIKNDILRSESELKKLSGDDESPDIKIMMGLKEDELNTLSHDIKKLKEKLDIDEIYFEKIKATQDPNIILDSPLIDTTNEIERTKGLISSSEAKLLEASFKYGPKHPNYKILNENLENEKEKLINQIENQLNIKKSIFEVEKKKLKSLKSSLNEIKIELKELSHSEDIYLDKLREVESYRNLYNMTLKRFQESQSISKIKNEVARVLDYALLIDVKKNNNRYIKSILILFAGVIFSLFISLFFGLLDQKIYNKSSLENTSQLPVLTSLPKTPSSLNTPNSFRFSTDKIYLESLYRLRTQLRSIYKDKKVISIASSNAKEGKSTTALHLAKALSEVEKTLLIDIDFRRQSITNILNIPKNKPGLSDIIMKKSKFSQAITQNYKEGFDVLGVGTFLEKPNYLLSSPMMKLSLDHLKKYYDRIIIETPPAQIFSDAESVSKLSDGVIIIVKSGHTRKKELIDTINQFDMLKVDILGTILTKINFSSKTKNYNKYIQEKKA
ncbi:GumC family protein [Marinomonas sp. TW1]|uniref:GumC family protein n=1 Tax=Marinomonas sp. TW1 TaxID=1561203 RepID=UPI0007AFAC24|nr:polysaccharide biosynthesis tyrosine autokinase [Marinomonas sp. TW1]KZN12225.1 hypothetical protein OA79_17330 [Marinomonas sp. TW1]